MVLLLGAACRCLPRGCCCSSAALPAMACGGQHGWLGSSKARAWHAARRGVQRRRGGVERGAAAADQHAAGCLGARLGCSCAAVASGAAALLALPTHAVGLAPLPSVALLRALPLTCAPPTAARPTAPQNLDYSLVDCQALVLAPTRELAQQIEKVGAAGACRLRACRPAGCG